MKQIRHTGRIQSTKPNVAWRVDILCEADEPFTNVGALSFDGDEPILLEWGEVAKHEPMQGASAHLRLISPSDRTFTELYTIEPGAISVNIYKIENGIEQLWWCGALDPELYEEPYERERGYVVELTFTDFGILERIEWDITGVISFRGILENAMERAGISLPIVEYISTRIDDAPLTLSELAVMGANFYDEDGEAEKLNRVVSSILQPLMLKIIQYDGKIIVYDIESAVKTSASQIEWRGDSSTLSVDEVYQKIKVAFSPYSSPTIFDEELKMPVKTPKLNINYREGVTNHQVVGTVVNLLGHDGNTHRGNIDDWLASDDPDNFLKTHSDFGGLENWNDPSGDTSPAWDGAHGGYCIFPVDHRTPLWDEETPTTTRLVDFAIFHTFLQTDQLAQKGRRNPLVEIVPLGGGSAKEDVAVAGYYWTPGDGKWPGYDQNGIRWGKFWLVGRYENLTMSANLDGEPVFTTKRIYLPPCSADEARQLYLRVSLPILCDPRFNPFSASSEDGHNDYETYSWVQDNMIFTEIPVSIRLYNEAEGGDAVMHYYNNDVAANAAAGHIKFAEGEWRDGAGTWDSAFFEYYDPSGERTGDNPSSTKCGILGWQTNHHIVGNPTNLKNFADGSRKGWIDRIHKEVTPEVADRAEGVYCPPFENMPDGEYIPYPHQGGWMEIAVWPGVRYSANGDSAFDAPGTNYDSPLFKSGRTDSGNLSRLKWLLYQLPIVEIVRDNVAFDLAEDDDYELTGWVNHSAKEELSIDLLVGVGEDTSPTARGRLLRITDGGATAAVGELTRGGLTETPEMLIINSIICQSSGRRTKLNGETSMSGSLCFTDRAQGDARFIKVSEIANLQTVTADTTYVEAVAEFPNEIEIEENE